MLKPKTHFEQVPLETVRKMVKEQIQREVANCDGIERERSEPAFALAEEISVLGLTTFLTGSYKNN
jgi:hypothetical protein